jgi:hypothetical protein
LFEDATKESGNLMIHMMLLRPQLLAATMGSQWAKGTTFGVEEGSEKHEECLRVTFKRALVELNIAFITALRTTLFPGGVAASDRLRLLHSAFFNTDITDLLARIVPAATTWIEQPWTMPGVVVATAIHRLAHSIQHASTRSLLDSMLEVVTTTMKAGERTEPQELDTRISTVFTSYRKFESVDALCNHLHSCRTHPAPQGPERPHRCRVHQGT